MATMVDMSEASKQKSEAMRQAAGCWLRWLHWLLHCHHCFRWEHGWEPRVFRPPSRFLSLNKFLRTAD
jgi:hypothetical protein